MASCDFSIEFTESAESIVKKANEAITRAGGQFNGDAEAGAFDLSTPIGAVKGTYTLAGSSINIHINHKPMFLGCDRIEKELRNYLTQQI